MKSQTLPPPAPASNILPCMAKSSGAVSRASFPLAAPASRRHVGHRSHMRPVFRVNSSFSSVIRRKRRQKHAVQHCPRHNLVTWASMFVHICTCECAAGSPTTATTAAREHFCPRLALLAGCGAHMTHKTRSRALSAGQSHHMGLYAHICTSKCAAGCPTPHVWLWSHGVLWQDRQASMCSAAPRYPICQHPLSDAC